MEKYLLKNSHVIKYPKSFPLGICFGALMLVVKEYIDKNV